MEAVVVQQPKPGPNGEIRVAIGYQDSEGNSASTVTSGLFALWVVGVEGITDPERGTGISYDTQVCLAANHEDGLALCHAAVRALRSEGLLPELMHTLATQGARDGGISEEETLR
jgi:hypothetical protein